MFQRSNIPISEMSFQKSRIDKLAENVVDFGIDHAGYGSASKANRSYDGPETGRLSLENLLSVGDSHTANHGAFGAIAFGIGTSEVEHVCCHPNHPSKSDQRKCWSNSLVPHKRDLFKRLHLSFDSATMVLRRVGFMS